MPDASTAVFGYEGAQTPFPMQALTNSGDNRTFTFGTSQFVSRRSGSAPELRIDGVRTGGQVTPGVAVDTVDVAALSAYVSGNALDAVAAAPALAVARPATDDFLVSSITVDAAEAIAVVAGLDGAAFSEVRGAAGGPPFVPVGQVEIAQVRYTSQVSAVVASAEILSQDGLHRESADNPVPAINSVNAGGLANVRLSGTLALIHTGSTPKGVFASWSGPQFVDVPKAVNFVPAENSATVNSQAIYGGTLGSVSRSLSAMTVQIFPESNIRDALIGLEGENLLFRYIENPDIGDQIITQGILTFTRANPADSNISMSVTVAAEVKSINVVA